jgi:hypothetical protein
METQDTELIGIEQYSLRTVWNLFLEACCRFWSNRFHQRTPSISPELRLLREELEYRRRENDKLVSSLIDLSSLRAKEEESNDSIAEMKPIRQFQPSWAQRRQELEQESRTRAAQFRVESEEVNDQVSSELRNEIASLEEELGVK